MGCTFSGQLDAKVVKKDHNITAILEHYDISFI